MHALQLGRQKLWVLILIGLPHQYITAAELPQAATRTVDFVHDIRPILSQYCYACHGPRKQESSYRLDHKLTALKGGAIGNAIVAKDSSASVLLKYVAGLDPNVRMPPEGDRLSSEQVGLLRAWIEQGASWPDSESVKLNEDAKAHWAFKAPEMPREPEVKTRSWVRNAMDRFVLARLEKERMTPSIEADRTTLCRRLYLDLVGLPPSPKEVDEFLADTSDKAYENLVERLLKSPHYGERWGRSWLDVARYADSDGYEKDKLRTIWFYRDWVVNALNRDLPYDQFVVEQLAGDLLPNPTQDQIVATGFLRNSMLNEEGGVDPEQFRMDAMFDRMDAIGKSILGLTIQCAQCHNHKYDPLTQEEYYQMFAFLNNDHEAHSVVYLPGEQQRIAELRRQMQAYEERLRESMPDWEAKQTAWEDSVRNDQPEWIVQHVEHQGDNGQRYIPQGDGSLLAQGYAPTKFTAIFRGQTELQEIYGARIELLMDPNLPSGGPGRSFMGTSALSEFKLEAVSQQDPSQKRFVKFTKATADFGNSEKPLEPNYDDKSGKKRVTGPVTMAIDDNQETAWGIDSGPGRRNQPRKAVFTCEENFAYPGGTIVHFHLVQMHGGWNSDDNMNHNLGRFRLSLGTKKDAVADPLPMRVREILAIPREKRNQLQSSEVFSYWRTTVPEWKETNDKIESLWKEWPAGAVTLTLASREMPRETRILQRGDFLKPARNVSANVPSFLHPLPELSPQNRLTFARWLVDRRSPTTARVIVNRIWQTYFGNGLVRTPEDFGTQADAPSHPELLDWLACDFMDHGWSLKALHRRIVTSSTYRQSARLSSESLARDPENRFLGRGPRLRVDGEIVRDIALTASGLLNRTIGGASVFTPAPAFLFVPPASYGPFNWIDAAGDDRYRRALYTFRRRSTPYPMLTNFDVPNGDFACVRRSRSNTPLQALTTLNESIFMDCARAMAVRVLREGGPDDRARLNYAARLCLSRALETEELQELEELLARQQQRIADGWVNAAELGTGQHQLPTHLPPHATPTQLAAYTVVSRVLLNLDETITKE